MSTPLPLGLSYVRVAGLSPQSYPPPAVAQAEGAPAQPAESRLFMDANQKCSVFFTLGLDGNKDYSQFYQDAPELQDFLLFLQGLYNEIKTEKKSKAKDEIQLADLDEGRIKAILNNVKKNPSLEELVGKIGDPELIGKIEQALKNDPNLRDLEGLLQKIGTQNQSLQIAIRILFILGIMISLSALILAETVLVYTAPLIAPLVLGGGVAVILFALFLQNVSLCQLPTNLHYKSEAYWQTLLLNLHQQHAEQEPGADQEERLKRIVSSANALFGLQDKISLERDRDLERDYSGPEQQILEGFFIPQIKFLLILAEMAKAPRSQNEEGVPAAGPHAR